MIKTVTSAHIDALLATVEYKTHVVNDSTTTVAVALLPIGDALFTLSTAISGCADPRKFNADLGAKYAIEKAAAQAKEKLWELEGYCLAKEINSVAPVTDHIDRMIIEHDDLEEKAAALEAFEMSDRCKQLDSRDKELLFTQGMHMRIYQNHLRLRLEKAGCIKFYGANWPELVDKFGGGELVGDQFVTPAGDSYAPGMWVK